MPGICKDWQFMFQSKGTNKPMPLLLTMRVLCMGSKLDDLVVPIVSNDTWGSFLNVKRNNLWSAMLKRDLIIAFTLMGESDV